MHPDTPSENALSNLADGEICTIVLKNGMSRDAAWSMLNRGWAYCDGLGDGFAHVTEVDEWWPGSVKF
jgi:hypothetical protein